MNTRTLFEYIKRGFRIAEVYLPIMISGLAAIWVFTPLSNDVIRNFVKERLELYIDKDRFNSYEDLKKRIDSLNAPQESLARSSQTIAIKDLETQINRQIEELRSSLSELKNQMLDARDLPQKTKYSLQLYNINKKITGISDRQEKIEKVIIESPSKAVELIMLKHDIEVIRDFQQKSIEAQQKSMDLFKDVIKNSIDDTKKTISEDIDRIFDINKWLFGGLSIGVFMLGIQSFWKPK